MTKLVGIDHRADRLDHASATSSSTTPTTRPSVSYITAPGWPLNPGQPVGGAEGPAPAEVLHAFLAEVQQVGVRTIRPNAPRAVSG